MAAEMRVAGNEMEGYIYLYGIFHVAVKLTQLFRAGCSESLKEVAEASLSLELQDA
jgi:hypothetical protein